MMHRAENWSRSVQQHRQRYAAIGLAALGIMLSVPWVLAGWYRWTGDRLAARGDLSAAASAYRKSELVHPAASTLDRLGTVYLKQNRPQAALRAFKGAVRMSPRDSRTYAALGGGLVRVGRVQEAQKRFQQAVTLDPRNGEAHLELSNLAGSQGDVALAQRELELAVQSGVHSADAHFRMAKLYFSRRDPRARDEFQAALALDPTLDSARLRLGCLLLETDPTEAAEQLQTARQHGNLTVEESERLVQALAVLAARAGNMSEAADLLREVPVNHAPAGVQATAALGYGVIARDEGDLVNSSRWMTLAAGRLPGRATFQQAAMVGRLALYGDCLNAMREGRLADASRTVDELLRTTPRNLEYHRLRAEILFEQGNNVASAREYRTASRIAPSNAEIWLGLAAALRAQGRADESLASLHRAIQLAPLWPQLRPDVDLLAGRIYLACGKPREAYAYLHSASNTHAATVNPTECLALQQQAADEVSRLTALENPPPAALPVATGVHTSLAASSTRAARSSPALSAARSAPQTRRRNTAPAAVAPPAATRLAPSPPGALDGAAAVLTPPAKPESRASPVSRSGITSPVPAPGR